MPPASAGSLYDAVLGSSVERLAEPLRAFHRAPLPQRFAGRARVERGGNLIAKLVATLLRLPAETPDCAVEVSVSSDEQGEVWSRRFDGKPFVSGQHAGTGAWSGLVVERIGPMSFAYAASERNGELHLDIRGWQAFSIPMPRQLGPCVCAREHAMADRFNFDVDIELPLIGRIVHYRGWLVPVPSSTASVA